jgi:hypothetical protein
MHIDFTTPSQAMAAFETALGVAGATIAAVVVISALAAACGALATSFAARCFLGLVVFACFGWAAYSWTLGRFVAAEVSATGVTLHYSGPLAKDIVLRPQEVKEVTFGMDDRHDTKCYIAIERDDSQTYKSAWLTQPARECRRIRGEILSELQAR